MAERIGTAVRLPAALHKQLQDQAEMRDVSVNFLITKAVEQFLKGLPTKAQLERTLHRG